MLALQCANVFFPILVNFTITLPSKIGFLIGSGEGKKLRANKALFYWVKNTAKNCTLMHKCFGIRIISADQTGRAFRWSAHLHKKAGFLRAGEAGERARAEGWDRVGIICADFRAAAPRCCVVFGSPWWVEEKEKPLPAGC